MAQKTPEIILALDCNTFSDAKEMIAKCDNQLSWFKVGMELYYSVGNPIVEHIKSLGHKVFLDLKLHDIPNTVAQSLGSLSQLEVDMINVHALGGRSMLEAAANSVKKYKHKPILIAVTILTSLDDNAIKEMNFNCGTDVAVHNLAKLCYDSGLDGAVCSVPDSKRIKTDFKDFVTVTPGIRPASVDVNDQKRIGTPADAVDAMCDYIVIGRAITQAKSPSEAIKSIKSELLSAQK